MRRTILDAGRPLGLVEVSDNQDPYKRREENIVNAMAEVVAVMQALGKHPAYSDWAPQPRLLHAIRLIVEHQNDGRRDEQAERDVFSHWVSHYGLPQLTAILLGSPDRSYFKEA